MAKEQPHLTDDYDMMPPARKRRFMAEKRELEERLRRQEEARHEYRLNNDEFGVHLRGQHPADEPRPTMFADIENLEDDWVDLEELDWVDSADSAAQVQGQTVEYTSWDELTPSTANNVSFTGVDNTTAGTVTVADIHNVLYGGSHEPGHWYGVSPASVEAPEEDVGDRISSTDTRARDLAAIARTLGYEDDGWEGTYDSRFGVPLPPGVQVQRVTGFPGPSQRFYVMYNDVTHGYWEETDQQQLAWNGPIEMYTWRLHQLRGVIVNALWAASMEEQRAAYTTATAQSVFARYYPAQAVDVEEQPDGPGRGRQ